MHKHDSTLSFYISLLKNHINRTADFTKKTDEWLSGSVAADLFFTDVAKLIFKPDPSLPDLLSSSQKILTIIKEIATCSKLHLTKLSSLALVLEELKNFLGNDQI
jgi:hypothetical protein